MKISYITMQFPAPSETFASNDVKTLKQLGIDIDIYSLKNYHTDAKQIIEDRNLNGLNMYSISKQDFFVGLVECIKNFSLFLNILIWSIKSDYNKPKFLLKILALIPASFYILKQLEKRRPDVVHLFWGHYPSLVAYLVKKRLKNTKLSIFLGAYDLEYSLGISKYICKVADKIFTHTNINIKSLEKLGASKKKINVIYRGTVIDTTIKIVQKEPHTFCTGGRLLLSKNFEQVIEVFYNYQLSVPQSKLTIFGDGPNKQKLIDLVNSLGINGKVHFTGFINQKEVLNVLSFSEFFLFFSIKKGERLPNVIKEAMLQECITVSTYTPGLDELIIDNENGFILKELNMEYILNLLTSLDESQKDKLKFNGKEYIMKNFDVNLSMKKYINIWKENE